MPLTDSRARFLTGRERSAREAVELLVDLDRPAEALAVARRARRRLLDSLVRTRELDGITAEGRARWEAAIAAYHQGRRELEQERTLDRGLSVRSRARAIDRRNQRMATLDATLDQAFLALGGRPAIGEQPRGCRLGGGEGDGSGGYRSAMTRAGR